MADYHPVQKRSCSYRKGALMTVLILEIPAPCSEYKLIIDLHKEVIVSTVQLLILMVSFM